MNIYVGNISYQTKEEDLVDLFSGMGAVDSARIIKDRETGRSKGFGFVEMPNDEEAKAAIEKFNGTEFGSRNITVNEAKPKEDKGPRAPRGGGFGGGNRRY
ncbi:MAG: RNA recognition motif domain-containing protein [Deferribacterales bacterium]